MAKKTEQKHVEAKAPTKMKFQYLCPACSDVAIETSNKMLDVSVDCKKCGKLIKLDDEKRYIKIGNYPLTTGKIGV